MAAYTAAPTPKMLAGIVRCGFGGWHSGHSLAYQFDDLLIQAGCSLYAHRAGLEGSSMRACSVHRHASAMTEAHKAAPPTLAWTCTPAIALAYALAFALALAPALKSQ